MTLNEAAKRLNLPKAEVAKRGTALKFNLSSLTEENIKDIATFNTDKPFDLSTSSRQRKLEAPQTLHHQKS